MAAHRPVTPFQFGVATTIIAATLIMASSFNYFFVGPIPLWLALGAAGLLFAVVFRRLHSALRLSSELLWIIAAWLALVVVSAILDVFGYMSRDVLAGPVLNLMNLILFVGLFTLATFADNRRVVGTIIVIVTFQALLGVAQYFGSIAAWRFPDTVASLFPAFVRIEYDIMFDVSMMSFEQVGRVRGSLPLVHLYNQIQAVLVSFCVMVALTDKGISFGSRFRNTAAWSAIGLGVIGVFLSFSRSGVLAVLGVVGLALILNPKPARILIASVGAALVLLALAYIGFSDSAQFERLTRSFDEGNSNLLRFQQYDLAWQNFLKNPMIGSSGPNGYPELAIPIHSVPLRYLNDYGLVGFVLYMCVFGGLVALFLRRLKSPSPIVRAWAGCGAAVLLAVVLDSWTHSSGFLRRDLMHTAMLGFVAGAMLAAEWRVGLGLRRASKFRHLEPTPVRAA